jgi:hypothetical protein
MYTRGMWEPNEIRVVRWFMRVTGVGLMVPGAIYLMSWPDTVRAFAQCVGADVAPVLAGASSGLLLLGGLSFVTARYARYGALGAIVALLLGAWVHYLWGGMMQERLALIPEGMSPADRALLEDAILFAANAQLPHAVKNLVLIGFCVVVYVLGPRLCGGRGELHGTADAS